MWAFVCHRLPNAENVHTYALVLELAWGNFLPPPRRIPLATKSQENLELTCQPAAICKPLAYRARHRHVLGPGRPGLARFFLYLSKPGPARASPGPARHGLFLLSTTRPGHAWPANLCSKTNSYSNGECHCQVTGNC